MKVAALLRAGIAFSLCPIAGAAAATFPSAQDPVDLGPQLLLFIAKGNIPGMAAVVLRGDRIVAQGVAGVRKRGAPEPIEIGDEFEIGSCAKAMTATLVAILVEERKLRWDTSLAEVFGGSPERVDPGWSQVTMLRLLQHRSGVTKDHYARFISSILFAGGDVTRERRRFAAKELAHPPDAAPGARFVYSNTNYVLIAAALEKITGQSWENLIRDRLFKPIGMATAGFGPPGTPGRVDQPWGHGGRRLFSLIPLSGGGDTPFDPGSPSADYPMAAAPAGLVHVSMADWAKFVLLHLRGDPANPHCEPELLDRESFAVLHRPDPGGGRSEGLVNYSAGWAGGTRPWAKGSRPGDTGVVLWHPGDNGRWNCVVWIAPEIDFAVLIACNRASMWSRCDDVAAALVHEFASAPRTGIPGVGLRGRWEASLGGQADGFQRLRLDLEIDDANPEHPLGKLDSVDEENSRFPMTACSGNNGDVRLEFKGINAVFAGKLSSDGSEMAGRWIQHGTSTPLVFRRGTQQAAIPGSTTPFPTPAR
jgi:CubicO group peptidase (beta-lactamase class C family)